MLFISPPAPTPVPMLPRCPRLKRSKNSTFPKCSGTKVLVESHTHNTRFVQVVSFIIDFWLTAPLMLQPSFKLDHLTVAIEFPKVPTTLEVVASLSSGNVFLCSDLSAQVAGSLSFGDLKGEFVKAPSLGLAMWS
jgi:hypothetical protein